MQSIPPLIVQSDVSTADQPVIITDAHRKMARDTGVTIAQLVGIEDLPTIREEELAWKYVRENPLVRPKEVSLLPTRMHTLHDWYLKEVNNGRESLMLKVKAEHYYHEKDLWIDLPEMFQLFNQDAIDKYLASCYCL